MTTAMRSPRGHAPARLHLLDGMRGLAAIAVMLYHLGNIFGLHGPFARSYLFVDFFFILSGFVLTLAAEPRLRQGLGTVGFMRARVNRLWPVIVIGALIGAAFQIWFVGWQGAALTLLLAVLMIPGVGGSNQAFPLNGPQWSLFFEVIANVLHGLVLHRLGTRTVLAIAVVSGAVLGWTIFAFGSNTLGPFAFNWWYGLPRIAFGYTLGIWLGRMWQAREHRAIVSWPVAFVLPVLAAIVLAGLPLAVAVGDAVFVLVLLPALFWLAATARVPQAEHAWLDRLGAISFPLYAVHLPILQAFGRAGHSPATMIAAAATVLAVSQFLAMTFETGGKRLAMAGSDQRRPALT